MMEEKKKDRRILRTKRLLLEGLTTLLMEKDVSQISVKELADYADINRGTFYLHYKDVYDMLQTVEDDLFSQFRFILDDQILNVDCPDPNETLLHLFAYLKENQPLVRALIGPHGDLAFISRLKDMVKTRIQFIWTKEQIKQDHFDFYCSFILYGFIGLIETWIGNDCRQSVKEMAQMSSEMILSGIAAFSK